MTEVLGVQTGEIFGGLVRQLLLVLVSEHDQSLDDLLANSIGLCVCQKHIGGVQATGVIRSNSLLRSCCLKGYGCRRAGGFVVLSVGFCDVAADFCDRPLDEALPAADVDLVVDEDRIVGVDCTISCVLPFSAW